MPIDPRQEAIAATTADPAVALLQRVADLERALERMGVRAGTAAATWIAPVFAAGWTSWSANHTVGYSRSAAGLVRLRGLITKTTGDPGTFEMMFTLPPGFRPGKNANYPALFNDATSGVSVAAADGVVAVRLPPVGGRSGWLCLDQVSFLAEG